MMRKLLYSFLFFISSKSFFKRSSTPSLGLLCVGMFFVVSSANATNYYTFTNGTPTNTNLWWSNTNGTGSHPSNFNSTADVFIIQSGDIMTTTGSWTVAGTVTVGNGGSLVVNNTTSIGTFSIDNGGSASIQQVLTITGTTDITGTISFGSTNGTSRAMTFTGAVTLNNGAVWNETTSGAAASFSFGNSFTNNATTFTAQSPTHAFTGSNRTLNGNTTTVIPTVSVTGSYTNNITTLTISSALSGNNGTLTNSSGSTLTIGGSSSITNFNNAGTANINGSGTISTPTANFVNTGTLNLNGTGNITGGITNNTGGTVNLASSGTIATFINATATSQLNISASPVPTINTLTTTTAGNTVNYNGLGNQVVRSGNTYSNLTISGSGTKTLAGTTNVNSNLTVGSGTTLDVTTNNYALNIGGDFTNNGTFTTRLGTVTLNGSGTQSFNVSNFYNLTLAGSGVKNFTVATTIVNALVITSVANLGSQNHSSASLTYGTTSATPSSWGSTASPAKNRNSYFSTLGTGILNVTCAFFSSVNPITQVKLNTLDKTSPNLTTSPAYEDFTLDSPTTLVKGQRYALTVRGNTTGYTNGYYTAYFDWNNNGVFTDSGENYTIGTIYNSTGADGRAASFYLLIPSGANAGNIKMRIVGRMDAYSGGPCVATNSIGQMEEYTVSIQEACTGNFNPGKTITSATPVCPNAPFTLSLENTVSDGATYTWQTSPTGTDQWTDAIAAPSSFFGKETFDTANSNASVYGNANITGGQLVLTTAVNSQLGAYVVKKTPGSNIDAFSVNFDYQITSGGGADGFSLSYADDVQDNDVGGEDGSGSRLVIQFDTYDNESVGGGSRIRVKYGNSILYATAINTPSLRPTTGDTPVLLRVDAKGKLTLTVNNSVIVSGLELPTDYLLSNKSLWRFKFSARTGAVNDKHVIDNLLIRYLDITGSGPTFTTSQTTKTYYRVLISCNSSVLASSDPVMVDIASATIAAMTYNACTGTAFTVEPVNGTNGIVPNNTMYTWTTPSVTGGLTGGAANTVASATITGTLTNATSTAQTATYTVTPITGGCTGVPFTLTVTVNPKPTANAGTAVAAICQGATSAAMGGSIGGGATGGTWSGGSGTWNNATSPSGATYTAGASESGNITLTLTATGVSCSPAIVTKTITVNPKPTVANAGADQYGNGAFTLAANVPTAGTGTWSIASGPSTALTQFSNVNAANATFTPLGAGVYTLNWTITTASCGSSTDDVVLSNCVGNLIQNGDFSNGTNNWSKATTKGTKVEVLKENVYFPNGNSENYTAELDVEASLGQTVSVIPNVPYTLSFIYARRPGSSPTVAVDVKIIDGSNTITRNYTTSDTTNSSVFQTIQFTPSTSSIWIEFYNSLETTTLGSIVDNIVLLPTSQVNPVATTTPKGKFKTVDACNGASVQLDVENVPASGVSYSWTTTSTGVTFSQNDIKNPKITVTGTGIKNATVVVTTAGGCSSVSSTTYVNVLALPVAGLVSNDADNTFCEGTSVTFTASGGTSYAFKVGSTTVQSGASDTYTTTALTNGQTVTVDVTNASGCTSTSAGITNTVTPNNTITLTSAAGTDSQTVCANTAITNITYSTNGATGVNFGILPAGISGIWAGNVATISGTPTVNSTNSYNYTITLTGGCGTITATGTINVDSLPVGGSIAGGTTVCSGTGDTVLTLSGNSGTIAHWESSLDNFATAGTVINNTSTTLTASNLTATTSYRAIITNGVCASVNSATATITVKPLPTTPTITKNNNVSCGGFGIITLTDLPANWTINQTGLTTGSRSFSGTDSSVPIQNLTIDTYSFTVKDNTTGCTSNAATVVITDESSITEWTDSGWSNGEPDGSKSVVIKSVAVDQPFKSNKPNVVACSLIIDVPTTGPDVEIPSNVTLRITNIVKSNGKLVFKSGSSLVQKDNVQNDGDIVYIRATDVRRFDLTYWSSPIKSTKPEGFRMQDLSPTTYFDKFLYWSSEYKWATNLYGTLPMEVGKGYSIRGPQEFDNVDGGTFEGKFIGVPNNGNIDVTGVAVDKYFFLGNPYPSPIDVEKLWDANPDVLGPLYFWIHALLPQKAPGDNTARYSSNDYIICTAAGSTDINGETAPKSFDGFIAAGQGFFAKPKTTVIHFNNDMREGATENTNFFKTAKSASIERNRIWLNIRNTEGAFKQILVGYIQGATNSVDFNYDAATLGANSFIDFYSINETKKLTIQGRALPFDNTDVVPLGYKSTIDSDFTIAIDHADGFFDKQEVYLEDKITGKIINLRNENYTFSTLAGTFADRFVLRYTNKTLGTGDFENIEDSVLISVKNKVVSITSSKETIKDVNIFNVGAQLMYSKNKVNSSELQINNLHSSDQVLLVKVTLENGSTVSKKVVFSNLP